MCIFFSVLVVLLVCVCLSLCVCVLGGSVYV